MDKEIVVDILNETELLEKYNTKRVNKDFIEYLIKEAKYVEEYEKVNITINNKIKSKIDIEEIITDGLRREYENISIEYHRNNIIQIALLIIGILLIFVSSLISEKYIWKEIILIIGWVPIWEAVDLELFRDFRKRRRKHIIAKLLSSEIKVK